MHIASIAFHYGPEVAASRYSEVWFNELGGLGVQGPTSAAKFLQEVLQELWKPQMIAFVAHQFHRRANRGSRRSSHLASDGQGTLQLLEDQREQVKLWAQSEHPFSWECVSSRWYSLLVSCWLTERREYKSIIPVFLSQVAVPHSAVLCRTRRDFAQDLYDKCMQSDCSAGRAFCSQNATWFAVLRAAVRYTRVQAISKEY